MNEGYRFNTIEEATKAVIARDRLIAVAAHELLTPLTFLGLQAEFLTKGLENGHALGTDELKRRSQGWARQMARLTRIARDLLDLSFCGDGGPKLRPGPVNLSGFVREVIGIVQDWADREGIPVIHFTEEPGTEGVIGNWDPDRLEQVLMNLLENAIKYGEQKPVCVTIGSREGWAWIQVADRGIGIRDDDLERIFEIFERAERSGKKGAGIGLYVAKKIVEAHGGRLSVSSNPGMGTLFTVELPLIR